jgi:hypothetical protein
MFTAGICAGACQWLAHVLMRNRTYLTPIPRYGVGVAVALFWFSLAYLLDTRQHPITGIWYMFGASGVATWMAYEADKKVPTEADVERFVGHIAAEHDESTHSDNG